MNIDFDKESKNYLLIMDNMINIYKKSFGLKSVIISLSLTTALRPWLINSLKYRALALNHLII